MRVLLVAVRLATVARSLAVAVARLDNGVDDFLLIELRCILFLQEIGGMGFGTDGGALRFTPIVVRSGEENFEFGPSFSV